MVIPADERSWVIPAGEGLSRVPAGDTSLAIPAGKAARMGPAGETSREDSAGEGSAGRSVGVERERSEAVRVPAGEKAERRRASRSPVVPAGGSAIPPREESAGRKAEERRAYCRRAAWRQKARQRRSRAARRWRRAARRWRRATPRAAGTGAPPAAPATAAPPGRRKKASGRRKGRWRSMRTSERTSGPTPATASPSRGEALGGSRGARRLRAAQRRTASGFVPRRICRGSADQRRRQPRPKENGDSRRDASCSPTGPEPASCSIEPGIGSPPESEYRRRSAERPSFERSTPKKIMQLTSRSDVSDVIRSFQSMYWLQTTDPSTTRPNYITPSQKYPHLLNPIASLGLYPVSDPSIVVACVKTHLPWERLQRIP